MSINDILDLEIFTPELFLILFFVFIIATPIGLIIGYMMKSNRNSSQMSADCTKQCAATLIAKNNLPHPFNHNSSFYTVVFETDEQKHIELIIHDKYDFDLLIEGDYGILYYQGNCFLDFERD